MECPEVPCFHRFAGFHSSNVITCRHQLRGDECDTKHDAQHLVHIHLLTYGPCDTHRQEYEYGLADQPQEIVDSRPYLVHFGDGFGAVLQKLDITDDIPKSQDQTADNDGRNDWRKYLRKVRNAPLQKVHLAFGRRFYFLFIYAVHPADSGKLIKENGYFVTYNYLELASLCKTSLYRRQFLDLFYICLFLICENKAHSGGTVGERDHILFPSDQF